MGLRRFQQIRRYLHCNLPTFDDTDSATDACYGNKIEPIATWIREAFQKYARLPSWLSIDEMMIKFSGRSSHTVKMARKPIKQGYKIIALCADGYIWDFSYWSRDKGQADDVSKVRGQNSTNCVVLHLTRSLQTQSLNYGIYMDNFFV